VPSSPTGNTTPSFVFAASDGTPGSFLDRYHVTTNGNQMVQAKQAHLDLLVADLGRPRV